MLLAIGFFLGGAPAFAETQYSSRFRWGFEYKAFPVGGYDNLSTLSGDNSQGDMVGFRAAHFIEGSFIPLSVGFEAYVGGTRLTRISGGDHLFYCGPSLSSDGMLTENINYELGIVPAFAEGNIEARGAQGSGFMLEPSASLGFILGEGWRISFRAGYLAGPSSFSGLNFGIRLDKKLRFTSSGVNN